MNSLSKITIDEIKKKLAISTVLQYYSGECINTISGSWWCIIHESGGKNAGHKTPSLIAKDSNGTATCMSQGCFINDDIFSIIAKMEQLDIRSSFNFIKQRACDIGNISYIKNIENDERLIKSAMPIKKNKNTAQILGKGHLEYLKTLGISKKIVDRFGLKSRFDYILYPQLENDIVRGYKGISITKDIKTGKSKQFFEDFTASLFHEINPKKGRSIIFTEGEKDCLRLSEAILREGVEDKFMVITTTTGAQTVPKDICQKLKEFEPLCIYIIYDNDTAGIEGSQKLATALAKESKKVIICKFPQENCNGYDVTDFLNEGKSLRDLLNLESQVIEKDALLLESSYLKYVINRSSILNTLTPDKILYTGYKIIDEQCPIIQGENTIIVGRTGKGKTVLGVNFVNNILKNNKNSKIIVFSLELKKKSFLQRLFAAEYNIEIWKIKRGFISEDNTIFTTQKERYIENTIQYISEYGGRLLIIDDIHSIEQIELLLTDLTKNFDYQPDYILIDYANILSFKSLVDSTKHIQISTWIKFLAKEKNIHVQAICQANRATKENDDGYARTENLADSDQYGRDAFVVYSIKTSMNNDVYSINPTKNRNGKPEKEIQLHWNAKSGKIFTDDKAILNNRF